MRLRCLAKRHRISRTIGWLALAALCEAGLGHTVALASAQADPASFDHRPWIDDFLQLRQHLSAAYANLLTAYEGGLDFPALSKATLFRLRTATDRRQAELALYAFVAAFEDGHLRLEPPPEDSPPFSYSLELAANDKNIILYAGATEGCSLVQGHEIRMIQGQPASAFVRSYEQYVASGNAKTRREKAAKLALQPPFAPPPPLSIEGVHAGRRVRCNVGLTPTERRELLPPTTATKGTEPEALCARLGYRRRPLGLSLEVEGRRDFVSLGGENPFAAGIFLGRRRGPLGVLRIASFGEDQYLDTCAAELRAGMPEQGADEDEIKRGLRRRVRKRLNDALATRLAQFRASRVWDLLVDVTGNGGGSGWAEDVARMLTSLPLPCPDFGMVKHDHWRRQIAASLAQVKAERAQERSSDSPKPAVLDQREQRLLRVQEALVAPCDLSPLFEVAGARPRCSNVVRTPSLSCAADMPRVGHPPGFQGRLRLLVDRWSASATEQFVAALKDHAQASVMGEPTWGVGCGYTDGGIPMTLSNSRFKVHVPDCIRYRKDGTNESRGIRPDLDVGWASGESARERTRKALLALGR